jgi:hypothetical protein
MQPSKHKSSPTAAELPPAPAVSIADGVALVVLAPYAYELEQSKKEDIRQAAKVSVIVNALLGRNFTTASLERSKRLTPDDYPRDTLAFLVSNADLVCVLLVGSSQPTPSQELETLLAQFDTREAEDAKWVVRICADASTAKAWGDFLTKHRPVGTYCVAVPEYEEDVAD